MLQRLSSRGPSRASMDIPDDMFACLPSKTRVADARSECGRALPAHLLSAAYCMCMGHLYMYHLLPFQLRTRRRDGSTCARPSATVRHSPVRILPRRTCKSVAKRLLLESGRPAVGLMEAAPINRAIAVPHGPD